MLLTDYDYGFFSNFTHSENRSIIHEDIQNRENILVTIGDS